ncbi:MAG: hypothetical protein ACOZBZ_00910 [Patescibacteria group bacterium]
MTNAEPTPIYNPALSEKIRGWTGIEFLGKILPNIVTLLLIITSLAAFFYLVIGGIRYITSGGDKAQMEQVRGQLTTAAIGLVLVFTLFAIMKVLGDFFGINLLQINLEPLILK